LNLQILVQRLDAFRPETRNRKHLEQRFGKSGPQFLVVPQLSGCDQFLDLLLERLANSLHFPQPLLAHQGLEVFLMLLERPRHILVRTRLERVFAAQFKQDRYLLQNGGDFFLSQIPSLPFRNRAAPNPL
jgi:hypothetical protein